jgi:phosphopantothenoylcysteine synthetase/decarboxylase
MKLRSKLLMYTASAALFTNMALAAINVQDLADTYIADGYTYVEIKTGPTQTKVEAVRDATKIEVIYDNETGAVIAQETGPVDDEYVGRTGVEIDSSNKDFEDASDDDSVDEDDDDENDDHGGDHDSGDDDEGDDDDDDDGDDHGGDDGDDSSDD